MKHLPKNIRIAVIQMFASPAPVTERVVCAEKLVIEAARSGAQLAVLPELFNTGYAYRPENFALAETITGPTVQWMKQVSARLGIHLAGSLLLRDGQDIYNALLFFAPDGHCWRYNKNYPWGWERAYFRGRRAITIASTELGTIGLMICWDIAHAGLWRQYAGKVDLIVACSCPPNLPDSIFHFPGGLQVTGPQLGPVFGSIRQSAKQVFWDTPAQQAAWLGVPFASSTACGEVRTRIPNPMGSFLGFFPTAPRLIRYMPQIRQVEVSASLVEAARIFAADGHQLAGLHNDQGEAFVLVEVHLPAERPQPRRPQPRPPVPQMAYLASDKLLTAVSLGTYARRNRKLSK